MLPDPVYASARLDRRGQPEPPDDTHRGRAPARSPRRREAAGCSSRRARCTGRPDRIGTADPRLSWCPGVCARGSSHPAVDVAQVVGGTRVVRSTGLSRTSHGVAWSRVWCARQSRTRLSRRGVAAVGPVLKVVGVAGERLALAAGEAAVRVAQHEGFPDRGGDQALRAADVEHFAERAEDGGDDVGVAREPAYCGHRQVVAGVQRRGTEPFPELVEGHRDGEPGLGAVLVRQQPLGLLGLQGQSRRGRPRCGRRGRGCRGRPRRSPGRSPAGARPTRGGRS